VTTESAIWKPGSLGLKNGWPVMMRVMRYRYWCVGCGFEFVSASDTTQILVCPDDECTNSDPACFELRGEIWPEPVSFLIH
jgi:hypothetical protein